MNDSQTNPAPPEVIAYLRPSTVRRAFGTTTLTILGLILIYLAFWQPPTFGWRLFLVAAGGGALYLSWRLWTATCVTLELTRKELRDSDGRVIATVDDMDAVNRGVFAFKPSNGFLLSLKTSGRAGWAPGLWWRVGRKIGVGGVTSATESRAMADILLLLLADRNGELEAHKDL